MLAILLLPVLQVVTLLTLPLTAAYAFVGLLLSPVLLPLLIIKSIAVKLIWSPVILALLPIAVPVGGVLAFALTALHILCAWWTVLTPLLWPLRFLCKWCCLTWAIICTIITDTLLPWVVPIRWVAVTALLPAFLK